jgi:hypothetical protein
MRSGGEEQDRDAKSKREKHDEMVRSPRLAAFPAAPP